jgi:hypothetical protein
MLPSSTGEALWLFFDWRAARALLDADKCLELMNASDFRALALAGVKIYSCVQRPGDLLFIHGFTAHAVISNVKSAVHLTFFDARLELELVSEFLRDNKKDYSGSRLPLLQYDADLRGQLGLTEEREALESLVEVLDAHGFVVGRLRDCPMVCEVCRRVLNLYCVGRTCVLCFVTDWQATNENEQQQN